MIRIYQIITILFAVFALTRVFLQKKNKNFSIDEFLFWSFIWVGVIILSFSGPILQKTAELVGIVSGSNLLMYASITLVFYMVYRLYAKFDQQQQEITTLVTRIALNTERKERKK